MSKITNFTELTAASIAAADVLPVVDISATTSGTKKITAEDLAVALDRLRNAVVTLTDAASIAINCDDGKIFQVTLTDNRTLAAPTGTPSDGQLIEIRVRQDAVGSHTLAYNAIYRFGTDVTSPTLTTTAAKTDYLLFQYNSTDTKWDCVSTALGY